MIERIVLIFLGLFLAIIGTYSVGWAGYGFYLFHEGWLLLMLPLATVLGLVGLGSAAFGSYIIYKEGIKGESIERF